MPHYNIWIREADNDKWLTIGNRSEWLHRQLNLRDNIPIVNDEKLLKISPVGAQKNKAILFDEKKLKVPKKTLEPIKDTEQLCPRHHVPVELCQAKH